MEQENKMDLKMQNGKKNQSIHDYLALLRDFFFFILKKSKFQKYMSVSKNFENIPQSPTQGATGPVCNFFLLVCK